MKALDLEKAMPPKGLAPKEAAPALEASRNQPTALIVPSPEEVDAVKTRLRNEKLDELARDYLTGEIEQAKEAGELGYYARVLVQVTMPHSDPKSGTFRRENGDPRPGGRRLVLSMVNDEQVGLPFGRYPRLLLAYVTTEAVRTRSREVSLGPSLSDFLRTLDLPISGGKRGTVRRLRDQMERLFSSTVIVTYEQEGYKQGDRLAVADQWDLWWSPKSPEQVTLWDSRVQLNPKFFEALVDRPVPVDLRALKALRSPLALDLYIWLGWRMFVLNQSGRSRVAIPWPLLQRQFGADYRRARKFKEKARIALKQVLTFYPEAKIREDDKGSLVLLPSPTPVASLPPKS
ncbi:MAG: replication protein RepA [Acidobacteriota bacterium]